MVKNNLPILLVSFFLAIALCSCNKNPALRNKGIQYWCVADTGADPLALQKKLDNGCNQFDCSPILPGGACFGPDGILGHSSWLLDKFYREFGVCEKGLGFINNHKSFIRQLSLSVKAFKSTRSDEDSRVNSSTRRLFSQH